MSQTDYKLVIETARGEMQRNGSEGAIEILKFEYGAEVARDGASGQAKARRRYTDVKFYKLVDNSSATLQLLLSNNTVITKATLTIKKAGGPKAMTYYKLILTDAYVSSYRVSGAGLDDEFGPHLRDEFALNYRKIEVEYTKQDEKGQKDGTVNFSDSFNEAR